MLRAHDSCHHRLYTRGHRNGWIKHRFEISWTQATVISRETRNKSTSCHRNVTVQGYSTDWLSLGRASVAALIMKNHRSSSEKTQLNDRQTRALTPARSLVRVSMSIHNRTLIRARSRMWELFKRRRAIITRTWHVWRARGWNKGRDARSEEEWGRGDGEIVRVSFVWMVLENRGLECVGGDRQSRMIADQ